MRNDIDALPPIVHLRQGMNSSIHLPDDVLGRIRAPTFFLWGTEDLYGGAAVATPFVAKIPGARLELMPGGHAVWMDDAERVAGALGAFLSG
jgi:pimeloyl-ACP methyl ester carboxylesterase